MKPRYDYVGKVIASTTPHTKRSDWTRKCEAAEKLVDFLSDKRLPRHLRHKVQRVTPEEGYFIPAMWEDLLECLSSIEPPFCFFGAINNGYDYGFYLCSDWKEQLEENGFIINGLPIDGNVCPKEWRGTCVASVNDHGNVSLYHVGRNGKFYLIWEVV